MHRHRIRAGHDDPHRDGALHVERRRADGDREGIFQAIRHQAGDGGPGFLGERARAAGAEPLPDRGGRDFRRLFQCHRKEPADHHRDRPRQHADRPQPHAAARSQGPDHRHQAAQGQGDRQQRAGIGLDLRGRQDPRAGRAHHQRRRDQDPSLHPDGHRVHQQGDRRRDRDPAVRLAVRGAEARGAVRRRRPAGRAAADDDRRHHGQQRLGEEEHRARAQLFHRLAARRARLLPSLSWRARAGRDHQRAEDQRDRAAPGAPEQVSVAGAQPGRADQRRQHARHPGLVREEQARQRTVSGGTPGRHELHRFRRAASSGRSRSRTRRASCRAAAERLQGGTGRNGNCRPSAWCTMLTSITPCRRSDPGGEEPESI